VDLGIDIWSINQDLFFGGSSFAIDSSVMWGTMPPISSALRFGAGSIRTRQLAHD
jgi:hypothetical protein